MSMENGEPMKENVTLEGVNNIRELETVVESRATLVSNSHFEDDSSISMLVDIFQESAIGDGGIEQRM